MNICCPNCKKDKANLMPLHRTLENGTRLQVVKCICGWEISRPEPPKGLRLEITRPGSELLARGHQRRPCTRVGCDGSYSIAGGMKYNLCPACSYTLKRWQQRRTPTPPPFIQHGGNWYTPEQLQGETA